MATADRKGMGQPAMGYLDGCLEGGLTEMCVDGGITSRARKVLILAILNVLTGSIIAVFLCEAKVN